MNIYVYTTDQSILKNEFKTINDFFEKYNVKCNIKFTSDYKVISKEILKIDIVFVYEDVWENVYNIIESQTEESQRYSKEVYMIKSTFPLKTEKLEKNKNKLLPKDKIISLKANNEIIKINSTKILYFENIERTVYAHTIDGVFEIETHIHDLEKILEKDLFISSYVSILVNQYWIKNIVAYEVILKNGEKLPLSQKKSAIFRKKHKKYLQMSN
ncbi:MAG: LytTR family DNA-binding domain-containing protein [Longicatena sp.]